MPFISRQAMMETKQVPLLFNFHGGGGNIADYMSAVDMRPIADTANFLLVYPQAVPDPGNGGSTSWMHKAPTTFDDVPFVEAMIDAIERERERERERGTERERENIWLITIGFMYVVIL